MIFISNVFLEVIKQNLFKSVGFFLAIDGAVAQLGEHTAEDRGVGGSSPPCPIFINFSDDKLLKFKGWLKGKKYSPKYVQNCLKWGFRVYKNSGFLFYYNRLLKNSYDNYISQNNMGPFG